MKQARTTDNADFHGSEDIERGRADKKIEGRKIDGRKMGIHFSAINLSAIPACANSILGNFVQA
jgi:hypothetical protein